MSTEHGICPNVVRGFDGTSHCALAESTVLAMRKKLATKLLTAVPKQGMKVNGVRVLRHDGRGYSEMRRQMAGHLEELARRYYGGEVCVVDEFLQLYCIGEEQRKGVAP